MSRAYQTVQLPQNRRYPTYQFYGEMASKKTTPRDGLRLAALLTIDWLRSRLGEHVPEQIQAVPRPSEYLSCPDQALPSFQIHAGYVVDVISLPERGIWSMQVTEPDLGLAPGQPGHVRQPVPGRVLETNLAYRVTGARVECGIQVVVSEPEGVDRPADVYRPAVVRRLLEDPAFGLRQVTALGYDVTALSTAAQLKQLAELWRSEDNQLPCVVFTRTRGTAEPKLPLELGLEPKCPLPLESKYPLPLEPKCPLPLARLPELPQAVGPKRAQTVQPYDTAEFARAGATYCRTYELEDGLLERFAQMTGTDVQPGDIVVLEPVLSGGGAEVLPYKPSKSRQSETMDRLHRDRISYPRGRQIRFGTVLFAPAARATLLDHTADTVRRTEAVEEQWAARLEALEQARKADQRAWAEERQTLAEQLERQRGYQADLERELERQRKEHAEELDRLRAALEDRESRLAYWKRKLSQPKAHDQIADWVSRHFSHRLILHPKAQAKLAEKAAQNVNIELICDALDFLATDYWERRYQKLSTQEMNSRCSEKYGRPFEIKPTGATTVEFTPGDYKIKYFPGAKGKPTESPLDYHLRVGNDPGNLLRIYFLHDDDKRRIVVGSLPGHLRAINIQ